MTLAQQAAKEIRQDNERYCRYFLKIQTKDGRLVRFRLNGPQRKIQAIVDDLERQGKPVRLIILKARQEGVSTWTQGQAFRRVSTRPNTKGLIIAHEEEASTNLFRMSQRFYEHLPGEITFDDGSKMQAKPPKRYSNRKELYFDGLDSQLRVSTAGSPDAARSSTIHVLHCSELAFWPDADTAMLALMQALADGPDTFAVLESTANGVGGYFYEMWQAAKRGENEFIPVFLAWWEMEEYQREFASEAAKQAFADSLTTEEIELQDAYSLTLEQLLWRRHVIANKCNGDEELFRQEYPSNDQEAFLVSGRPFFNRQALTAMSKKTEKPARVGYLKEVDGKVAFVDDEDGYIKVWKEPEPYRCYAIGGDVAEGLEKGDYSAASVIDRDTFEQVATWHGHIDPDELADELVKLAKWYNEAWLGIEVNNHGLSTNKKAAAKPYLWLYRRKVLDTTTQQQTEKLGWHTNTQSRPVMLDDLATTIREGTLTINDEVVLNECVTFVRNEKGKPEAQEGCYDDLVMSLAIAVQMHNLCPLNRQERPEKPLDMSPEARRRRHFESMFMKQTSEGSYTKIGGVA